MKLKLFMDNLAKKTDNSICYIVLFLHRLWNLFDPVWIFLPYSFSKLNERPGAITNLRTHFNSSFLDHCILIWLLIVNVFQFMSKKGLSFNRVNKNTIIIVIIFIIFKSFVREHERRSNQISKTFHWNEKTVWTKQFNIPFTKVKDQKSDKSQNNNNYFFQQYICVFYLFLQQNYLLNKMQFNIYLSNFDRTVEVYQETTCITLHSNAGLNDCSMLHSKITPNLIASANDSLMTRRAWCLA